MRRIAIIMAGAALALALVGPAVAGATDKTTTSASKITAQSVGVDAPISALHHGGHRGGHDRHDRGHYRRGGRCYGCDGPGSRCGRYGCDYRYGGYYGGGYYGGGYGCNYDYPCGEPRQYDCTRYRDRDGKAVQDPHCKYDQKCDCYYHSSDRSEAGAQPPADEKAQPAPDQGQEPPGDQGMEPAPDGGQQPPPDKGTHHAAPANDEDSF